MKTDNNICPRCKYDQLKVTVRMSNPCPLCGYPLELWKMLARVRNNQDEITEVISLSAFGIDTEAIALEEVLNTLAIYDHMAFPLRDEDDMIMIRVENDYFIFNFGAPGEWKKYVSKKGKNS